MTPSWLEPSKSSMSPSGEITLEKLESAEGGVGWGGEVLRERERGEGGKKGKCKEFEKQRGRKVGMVRQ